MQNRRGFIKRMLALCGISTLGWLFHPLRTLAAEPETLVNIGKVDLYPEGQPVRAKSAVTWPAGESVDIPGIFIIRWGEQVTALSDLCTHRSCPVEWDTQDNYFECPCHRAQFDIKGNVRRGPAKKPLLSYSARIENGYVVVQL